MKPVGPPLLLPSPSERGLFALVSLTPPRNLCQRSISRTPSSQKLFLFSHENEAEKISVPESSEACAVSAKMFSCSSHPFLSQFLLSKPSFIAATDSRGFCEDVFPEAAAEGGGARKVSLGVNGA